MTIEESMKFIDWLQERADTLNARVFGLKQMGAINFERAAAPFFREADACEKVKQMMLREVQLQYEQQKGAA